MSEKLPVRKTESIFDLIKEMEDRITRRAYEIFHGKGGTEVETWLQAEKELVWCPALELSEKDGVFRIKVAVPGVDAKDIHVEASPQEMLIKAELSHEHKEDKGAIHTCEFETGRLFRAIHLPARIDPNKVKAELKNGMITVTAVITEKAPPKKIKVEGGT